jgi:peptidoglycan/LPS O-acetylase OafA/YrhL
MSKSKFMRFKELDALRGLAALSVVLFHYTAKYREFFGHTFPEILDLKYGYYGVAMFFIISGFVIFMTVNTIKSASEFVFKRFIRLYPTFWVCMIITFLGVNLWGLLPKMETSWYDALFNLTMFYRVLRVFTEIKDVDGAYWSLLPELQFYFLIFLVFLTKQLRNIKLVALFWLILIIIENFLFHIRILGLFIDLTNGGFFIAGILFYKIAVEKENSIWNHLFILTTLIINVLLYIKLKNDGAIFMIPLIYLIFYLFTYGKLSWLDNKILLFLGAISYPLYLIHQNLGYSLIKQFEIWGYTGFYVVIFTMLVFIFAGYLISFYVEKPILNFVKNKQVRKNL